MDTFKHSIPQTSDRTAQRRREIFARLSEVYSLDQLDALAAAMSDARAVAIQRRCSQEVSIILNEKGFPRVLRRTDCIWFVSPLEVKPT